ncbi:hypothetical protein BCR41DRAFT_365286 [Lobosporangium transversale]|uniref:Uncharacterized protein n=1 Tax=Lobosporangium transversale TaxID=64571 RepID=A0A1Y2G5D2_9FUNG|nr:hypothetical protein BCR41DRAFT_365286 [Lobosporangium transversale]ORY95109.1 hypothetical protein BCR41DRAFT_365286 [Lobosporangium transversale]|eukprot:XP_021875318.1 hypothetical protein BCR41DRAFT_365286 [Lobosporangium transversale]
MAMLLVAATFRSSLFRTLGSRALAAIGISCSLVFILWLIQMLVIRYRFRMPGSRFFLVPQQSARTGFHHWEFFWAFFNIVFGAFSFFKRIALSVLSMGIYSTRIDLCIMGGRFRPWDGGYSAFVGLVLADHVMNNPIVLEFVQILRDLLLARRNPHLAHLLEAKGRTHPDDVPELDEEAKAERNKQIIMIMNPVRRGERYPGARRPLTNIEEDDEAKMEDLLVATSNESGIGVGAGGGLKGGLVVPEVSKIHHYFRVDQRVDRHKPGQGPASRSSSSSSQPPSAVHYNSDRVSKVYTPLLVSGEAKHQIPITPQDPESVVSQEQIRQTLSEAKLRSIRNRNRWFLYVTLVRNPSIRPLRRTKIKDFLHPIGHGAEYTGSHLEEMLTDIHWDQED